jgi:hypothetical protein
MHTSDIEANMIARIVAIVTACERLDNTTVKGNQDELRYIDASSPSCVFNAIL